MFDFSFPELMVVLVVGLIIIGPERLPKVARTLGHLWGRAQRYVNGVKAEIERDIAVEEFRQLQQKVQAEAGAVAQSFQQATQTADQQMQKSTSGKAPSPGPAMQPDQATQLPPQPAVHPSATPPANKSE
jgi:sec-independent protein translocase protein TatB